MSRVEDLEATAARLERSLQTGARQLDELRTAFQHGKIKEDVFLSRLRRLAGSMRRASEVLPPQK